MTTELEGGIKKEEFNSSVMSSPTLKEEPINSNIKEEEVEEINQFQRFSKLRRSIILVIVSIAAILSPLSSTIYFPSIEVIKEELNTEAYLVDTTITIFMLFLGIFPLIWGGISDRYGRRYVYIVSQTFYTIGNIGCALANDINLLIFMRAIQGLGASAAIVTGVGTITDLYPRNERGSALSIYFLGPLVGPVLGPIIGGILNEYLGWRSTFWLLTILGGFLLLCSLFILVETLPKASFQKLPYKITFKPFKIQRNGPIFNPLYPLIFLKYPVVVLANFGIAVIFGTFFAVEASQSRAMYLIYKLNSWQVGLTFIALGLGSILGNILGGQITDFNYKKELKKDENPKPEVRLYTLWTGSIIILIGLLLYGWFLQYELSLWLTLLGTFIVGIGNTFVNIGLQNYLVDIFSNYSSSIAACYSCIQLIFTAIVTAVNTPLIDSLGYGGAYTFWAAMCALVTLTTLTLLFKGHSIRLKFGPNN